MGGNAPEFVWRDGSRLTPYMAYQVERLNADMVRLFGVEVRVTSGIRTHQEQIDIFLSTYTAQASGSGPFGDVRWWGGTRYVRYDPSGTAAAPGESNHEIQGDVAAMDLRDTGSDPGISSMGSARSEWLRVNCGNYGMEPEGFQFGEAWHYRIPGIYQSAPTATPQATTESEEDNDMYAIRQAGVPNSGIIIRPGVPPYSLPDQVFETEASTYGLNIRELPDWRYGTAVREQWTAFGTAQQYSAGLSQTDIDKIAQATRDKLGGIIPNPGS